MKSLYGNGYWALRKNMRMLHPAYDRWTVEFLYGRMLSRGVLSLRYSSSLILPKVVLCVLERSEKRSFCIQTCPFPRRVELIP